MIELRGVQTPPDAQPSQLMQAAAKKLRVSPQMLSGLRILRRAVDARRKPDVRLVHTLALEYQGDETALVKKCKSPDVRIYEMPAPFVLPRLSRPPVQRPVICGAGPAGLFAALCLAEAGACPLLIERGGDVDSRAQAVEAFRRTRILDPDSNVQFGEGGAGTFSDGKLTTNISDPRCARVLKIFYEAGAPEEILYLSKPHIGTDLLPGIIRAIRLRIEAAGGEVRFHTRLCGLHLEHGVLRGVRVACADGQHDLDTDTLILAAGHSARDLFSLLDRHGAQLVRKPFSLGVRIEHPQKQINLAQYGREAVQGLGAADYKLSCHLPSGRGVYTFCMCPGGEVIAAASETGSVVVNGMSRFARDGENANCAFLVGVEPSDFGGDGPLAGIEFQRRWERAAFVLGGGDYHAPAQLLGDFLQGVASSAPGCVLPSYPLGVCWCDVSACLPAFAVDSLKEAVPLFDRRLHGFALPDAVLTGVETRSSSPVRIVRGEDFQSNLRGLYPCGEGAGYAGGIMSAAVDGLRVAEAVLANLPPFPPDSGSV